MYALWWIHSPEHGIKSQVSYLPNVGCSSRNLKGTKPTPQRYIIHPLMIPTQLEINYNSDVFATIH